MPKVRLYGPTEAVMGNTGEISKDILPIHPLGKIVITRRETPLNVNTLIKEVAASGGVVDYIPMNPSTSSFNARPRLNSHEDMIMGYQHIYENPGHYRDVFEGLKDPLRTLGDLIFNGNFSDPKPLSESNVHKALFQAEVDDFTKIAAIKGKPVFFMTAPWRSDIKKDEFPPRFYEIMDNVVLHLGDRSGLRDKGGMISTAACLLADTDPLDTNSGTPLMVSGPKTAAARIVTSALYPKLTLSDHEEVDYTAWLNAIDAYVAPNFNMPPGYLYSSVLGTRTKNPAIGKMAPLFTLGPEGYFSNYDQSGLEANPRLIFMQPGPLNAILSGLSFPVKKALAHIPGFLARPDLVETVERQFIQNISKGHKIYTNDFSGMDTGMSPHLITSICRSFIKAKVSPNAARLLMAITNHPYYGVITPSFFGDRISSSHIRGFMSWASGFKPTSAFDLIYNISVMLYILERYVPSILRDWMTDKFIFRGQGDDGQFTLPLDLDPEATHALGLKDLGVKLKFKKDDPVFLKVGYWNFIQGSNLKSSRLFSRFIQNEFFPEGDFADYPDGVSRLSQYSRLTNPDMVNHPLHKIIWPKLHPVVASLKFNKTNTSLQNDQLKKGTFSLNESDLSDIRKYAESHVSWISALADRAQFSGSDASIYRLIIDKIGISSNWEISALEIRKKTYESLIRHPKSSDLTFALKLKNES